MSKIKHCFESRFGQEEGRIVEFDYRQLEIRVLALATWCPQLIDDINNDIDLHTYFASQIYNKPEEQISPQERKMAKGFSFQLQYGAGANSISKFWKVDKKIVENFIAAYYTRYPEVELWQNDNIQHCERDKVNLGHRKKLDNGTDEAVHSTYVPNIWGFPGPVGSFLLDGSLRTDYRTGQPSEYFSPTQIKNYPIQGGAADIVLLMLAKLNRLGLVNQDEQAFFVNTVHDSFVFDWFAPKDSELQRVKDTLETVPAMLKDMFGIDSPVKFPVDVSVGPVWGQTTEINLDIYHNL